MLMQPDLVCGCGIYSQMKTGERQTPTRGTRTHKAENLPSVSSALKRGGDAGLFSAPPTAILSAPLTCMPSVLLQFPERTYANANT